MWKSTQGRVLAPFSGAAGPRSVPSHQWRGTLMDASTQQFETLIRSAARRLKGHHRRLFLAEVTTRLCDGNPRQAERRFGWGRDTVTKGLHETTQGIRC